VSAAILFDMFDDGESLLKPGPKSSFGSQPGARRPSESGRPSGGKPPFELGSRLSAGFRAFTGASLDWQNVPGKDIRFDLTVFFDHGCMISGGA
jgi:hypothetical protein